MLLLFHFLEVESVDGRRLGVIQLVVFERNEPLLFEVLTPNEAENGAEAEGEGHCAEVVRVRLLKAATLHRADLGLNVVFAERVVRHAMHIHFMAYNR